MTSQSATTTDVIATSVTTSVNKSRPCSIDLTAADIAVQPVEENSMPDLLHKENQEGHLRTLRAPEPTNHKTIESRQLSLSEEAAIPQDPQQHAPLASEFPPSTVAELARMDALARMMAYNRPVAGCELSIGDTPQENVGRMHEGMMPPEPQLAASAYLREAHETLISAYAMLEFPDGQFYMNTYSVILGRDLAAARAAQRRDVDEARRKEEEEVEGANNGEPKTPVRTRRDESRYTRSVISESGGILREGDDSDTDERARRRKNRRVSKKSKSTGSSSQRISRRNSLIQPNGRIDYQPQPQARRYAPDSAGAVPVDPASLRPSPHDCPLVGIHPPATTAYNGYKAISRKHVKIAYNSKKNLFEAEILGRNGAFVDDTFYHHMQVVPLKSGSQLQIGGVVVKFVLPDVALGETGAEHPIGYDNDGVANTYSEGGKEMSFEFEDTPRDGVLDEDSSEEASSNDDERALHNEAEEDGVEDENDDGEDAEDSDRSRRVDSEDEDEEEEEENQEEEEVVQLPPSPPKRRGPGRPPKNGIMSKREQALAKKEAQQKAKKSVPQQQVNWKNKVGRPRKHPRPETPPVKTEKRKYTKRKPKDPDAAIKKEGSLDDEKAAKEKKEKKSSRPPRSPSPTFNEAELTPEQLAKPQSNYVTLIHDALKGSKTGQMSLPQIYRSIQRKYPFFVLRCNTNGWQSSVRHNLSQHHAFRKVERDGKGWMWAIVDGVPIEKEKKRRPTPPHQLPPGSMHQQIYRAGPALPQHMMPRVPGMIHSPPGYPMNGLVPPNLPPGQHPHYSGDLMNGHNMQVPYPALNGQNPQNFTGTLPSNPSSTGSQTTGYSSPYAPKQALSAPDQNPPNVTGDQNRSPLGLPPQVSQQQGPSPYLPGPHLSNESTALAIDTFKTALIGSLKGKSNNAEAVVTSAINRVLGIASQSTVPDDPNEEKIMVAFRSMLDKLVPPTQPPHPIIQQKFGSPQSQHPLPGSESLTPAQTNPTPSNAGKTSAPNAQPVFSIARPSFSSQSQNRLNGSTTSVPRPPMMTPGIARSSPAISTPALFRPGGATPNSALPTPPAPSIISNDSDMSEDYKTVSDAAVKIVQIPHVNNENQNPNGKRPREDLEDVNGNEREFKRLSATGPQPLKA